MFYVYILQSLIDNSFYIGQTENIEERLKRHNAGRSRYTKELKPWKIVYVKKFLTREKAIEHEAALKNKKSRKYIEKLIEENDCPDRRSGRKSL